MKNNLIDFGRFKTIKELQEYCNDQYAMILSLQVQNEDFKNKIDHLEQLLKSDGIILATKSNEEELCKLEIGRLYSLAKLAPLDDKETKRFEILVKTLLAIQGKVAEVKPKKKEENKSIEELIALAVQAMPEANEQ